MFSHHASEVIIVAFTFLLLVHFELILGFSNEGNMCRPPEKIALICLYAINAVMCALSINKLKNNMHLLVYVTETYAV